MKLTEVTLGNFKSFQEYQAFSFDIDNGLYFVTGENKVEPDLGANGAGKSALFEAICWCLYGKTSTNLKAGNIVNWDNKGCSVMIKFDNGDMVQRDQNPNRLNLNDNPVTQEELEKHLGNLGFESFLYSTFISQFSSKFFDLSPADKMIVFSDIMFEVLQPWWERSLKAKTKAVQIEVTIRGMEDTISKMQGRLEQLNKTDYSQQIKEFDDNKKDQLKKAKFRLQELTERKRLSRVELQEAMKKRAKVQMAQKQFKPVTSPKEYNDLKDKYTDAINKQAEAKANYISKQRDIKGMEGTVRGGSICPTCKQIIDKRRLKEHIDEAVNKLDDYFLAHRDWESKATSYIEKLREIDKQLEVERDKVSEMKAQERGLDTSIRGINTTIQYTNEEIEKQHSNIDAIEGMKNNFVQLEKERQDDIKKFKVAIKDNEDLLNEAKKEFDAYTYWIKGFKEIRLLLMLESLKEFEVSINNNLNKFGMGDWNVKLDIDQENKSGTIRKGFAVLVESPNHNGFVPFEVWSGGEGQRLRLAGTIGLMDLIQSKRQVDFGLEVFDEPTAWLSDKGIDDLCQALYYRAKENEKKIFLIDHKNLGSFGGFHSTINIVKDERGSHIKGE